MLVDQLRDAIDQLALEYEHVAFAALGETERERVLAKAAGTRR